MRTVGKWYLIVAVVVFTFCVSIMGRTPAGHVLHAAQWVVGHAPNLASFGR